MQLTYSEILKLKGKTLINVNPTSSEFNKEFEVTSSTKNKVVLNQGISIPTSNFFDDKQKDYEMKK